MREVKWSNRRSRTDSRELVNLRERMIAATPGLHLTPARMGAFAAKEKIKITNFGGHSKRWIELFNKGGLNA